MSKMSRMLTLRRTDLSESDLKLTAKEISRKAFDKNQINFSLQTL
jgi:hypothetical protein